MNVQDAMRKAMKDCFENWPACQRCGSPFWWVREGEAGSPGGDLAHCYYCPDSKIKRDPEAGTWSYVTIDEAKAADAALDDALKACAVKVAQRMVEDLEAKLMVYLAGPGR